MSQISNYLPYVAQQYGVDQQLFSVWEALSHTFLDVRHTRTEFERLAIILAQSPFSDIELECILFNEVGPVCAPNKFRLVGGEKNGFLYDWLIPRCQARRGSSTRKSFLNTLFLPLYFDACRVLARARHIRLTGLE